MAIRAASWGRTSDHVGRERHRKPGCDSRENSGRWKFSYDWEVRVVLWEANNECVRPVAA